MNQKLKTTLFILTSFITGVYFGNNFSIDIKMKHKSEDITKKEDSKRNKLINIIKENYNNKKEVIKTFSEEKKEELIKKYDKIPSYFQEVFFSPNEIPKGFYLIGFDYLNPKEVETEFGKNTKLPLYIEDIIEIIYHSENENRDIGIRAWRYDNDISPSKGLDEYGEFLSGGSTFSTLHFFKYNKDKDGNNKNNISIALHDRRLESYLVNMSLILKGISSYPPGVEGEEEKNRRKDLVKEVQEYILNIKNYSKRLNLYFPNGNKAYDELEKYLDEIGKLKFD
ncbi:MAG: hypothetical protein QW117_01020 [Candidatus Pacearchaeota archaeon]